MCFEADEEILQDFLVEAGEILELLQEQLVDLEQRPEDMELLNAIFRGFHTIKGGAGFLQLKNLVDCCHIAENVFDIMRNGQRSVTSELMDVILPVLDAVNVMFDCVRNREELVAAPSELLAELEKLARPESEDETSAPVEPTVEVATVADAADAEFDQMLASSDDGIDLFEETTEPTAVASGDEITEEEFEALLNELHGEGRSGTPVSKPKEVVSAPVASSNEINDDEFDALLDELHGTGKGPTVGGATTSPAETKTAVLETSSDQISDDEFENLLDQLHGVGKGPAVESTKVEPPAVMPKVETPKIEVQKIEEPKPAPVAKSAAPVKKPAGVTPAATDKAKAAPVRAPAKEAAAPAETTVRVDTKRLDDIMNMVGELVLVRNRLVRLGMKTNDEEMSKAVSNLDVVTADLQTSVMKTRMQPIKKVFGRFPRVVRDLARTLKKEVNLELIGEDTDLDKNLVEALADPLVHLVRNAVDHGVEMPDVRESNGKTRTGKVVLSAEQEGDHILLSIQDDGGGMDPNVLRRKAVEKGLYDQDAADRLSNTEAFNLIFHPKTLDQLIF